MMSWPTELIAQFPLPDTYEWIEGDGCSYPHLRFRGEMGWDTRWVYDTDAGLVVTYPPYSAVKLRTYPVQSPEEAIALIYNLVLFGEQT